MKIQANMELKCWSQSSNRSVLIFSVLKAVSPSLLKRVYKSNSRLHEEEEHRGRKYGRKNKTNGVFSRWPESRNCIKRRTQRRNKIALSFPNAFPRFIPHFLNNLNRVSCVHPLWCIIFCWLIFEKLNFVARQILIFRTKLSKLFFDLISITKYFF